jgi:hypothetical protein
MVEQHPDDPGEVGAGREQPGVAGHPAQQAGALIVHLTSEKDPLTNSVGATRGSALTLGWKLVSASPSGRHGALEVPIERSAADPPDGLGQQDEPGVAVLERQPGG